MNLTTTLVFYVLAGVGVAVAELLVEERTSVAQRTFRVLTAVLFWPLYLPVVLRGANSPQPADSLGRSAAGFGEPGIAAAQDEMAAAISRVESELQSALRTLDGWSEDVLAREHERISELRSSWRNQAVRIRELDQLLAEPEFLDERVFAPHPRRGELLEEGAEERLRQSQQARQDNIARLRAIRNQMHEELMGTLAWVRELVTMIHLARFSGAPVSRTEELVTQIAAAVEGLSEVATWRQAPLEVSQVSLLSKVL